jgi:hypothetical protein
MILYAFITHQTHLAETSHRITAMMQQMPEAYLIACGGYAEEGFDPVTRILRLACDDTYAGLPQKVTHLCRAFAWRHEFKDFSYLVKLDEDMAIIAPVPEHFCVEYGGHTQKHRGRRDYHLGKCPGSSWNTQRYDGPFLPWNRGGYGYILSKKAAALVAENRIVDGEIYEDLMVAKILAKQGIQPIQLPVQQFWISCQPAQKPLIQEP